MIDEAKSPRGAYPGGDRRLFTVTTETKFVYLKLNNTVHAMYSTIILEPSPCLFERLRIWQPKKDVYQIIKIAF